MEFFAALGPAWPLTAAQQSRLAPAVLAALADGWAPQELAGFTGTNSGGVRNPYAVLAARLSPAELPSPSGTQLVRRPPWCGQCDERTRRCEDAQGADAGRCSVCHPLADAALAAGTAGAAVDDLGLTGAGGPAGGHDPVSVTAYDWTRAGFGGSEVP